MSFDVRELRNAYGAFMTGVTVVTAVSESGEKVGFTANSFTSVSVDPALVLICPAKSLSSFEVFNRCSHFAINILTEHQQEVSNVFASAKGDRFSSIDWHNDDYGTPLIDGAAAYFSCSTYNNVAAGDHIVLIGKVEAFDSNEKLGLGYAKGGYFSLGLEHRAEELSHKYAGTVGAIIEWQDKVLLVKTDAGYGLPQIKCKLGNGTQETIREYLDGKGLDVELGSVFSIYENSDDKRFSTYYRAVASRDDNTEMGEFVPVDQLSHLTFVTSDIKSMMHRYMMEKQNGVFRVYVGDNQSGDIH